MERVDYIRISKDKSSHCDKCKKIIDFDSLIPNTLTVNSLQMKKLIKFIVIFCFENRGIPNNLSRNKSKKYKKK